MTSSAPKFASFRPKPKISEQSTSRKSRHEEKEHHRKHSSSRDKEREERTRSPLREKPERHRDKSPKRAYYSDRRGDTDIVKYGSLNPYHVPSYRRSGYGNILGLPGQKIDREYSTEKKIHVIPLLRQRQKRMLIDKHAGRESKRTMRLVKAAQNHSTDATRDFIALSSTLKRKRAPGSGSGSDNNNSSEADDSDAADVDYRGIREKDSDPDKLIEADAYYESDTEAAITNSEVTQKHSRLIRESRDEPGNLQTWLDLIEHQEPMMKLDQSISDLSAVDRQNLADIRIATYEEALRKIGNDASSQMELQAGLLREAQRHWDNTKVMARWQTVLKCYPHSVKLWFGYLDFVQSTFSSFRYEECRAVFLRALEALQSSDFHDGMAISEARLHLFVRLTTLIQQAGYQELALAIWQAVLEFNFLAPHDLVADKIQRFEEFWESEAPRIGEAECKGWRHTSIDDAVPPACSITLDAPNHSKSSISDLRRLELESISKLRYPGRSADDVGEDDPFHTIFFSDLKDYVTNYPNILPEMQIDAFLCFCGLPSPVTRGPCRPWRNDPYLQARVSSSEGNAGTDSDIVQYHDAYARYVRAPLAKLQMTSDLLVQQTFSLHNSRLSPDFVRNTLNLIATNLPHSEFMGEYLLAFESKHFPSEVAKSAKRLLKNKPSSVRLYNVYAIAEARRNNAAKADQIFAAALNINALPVDRLDLLQNYVWHALDTGNKTKALRQLVQYHCKLSSAQLSTPDSGDINTARMAFQKSLTDALLAQDYALAVLNTSNTALLVYLAGDCDVDSALQVHQHVTAWFYSHKLSSSIHAETHAQSIAHLLAYHVTHTSIVKPAVLRDALEPLIATFSDNTILLTTYAANEARFSIDDRVRGNMHRVLNTSPDSSITTWTFAIHHEILKSAVAGSTSHSIRALYKRATAHGALSAHSPALWDMYMHFELQQWRKERTLRPNKRPRRDGKKNKWETRVEEAEDRVRETFYQGLKMLPWCKDFVMGAFTDAIDLFSEEELWRLYRVMTEKELRVYTELDEPKL